MCGDDVAITIFLPVHALSLFRPPSLSVIGIAGVERIRHSQKKTQQVSLRAFPGTSYNKGKKSNARDAMRAVSRSSPGHLCMVDDGTVHKTKL